MTHQEMEDFVSDELRNKRIAARILGWLNRGQDWITARIMFGQLNDYFSEPTSAGNPDITLPTTFHWLKTIQIPVENTKLYPINEAQLAEANPKYRTMTGTVQRYYLNGIILGLWYVPAGIKVVTGSFQKRAAKLLSDYSVVCELPEEWHEVVCLDAIVRGYSYENDPSGKQSAILDRDKRFKELAKNAYKRPDDPIVMGEYTTNTGRPPRPRLPNNYPQPR